MFAFQYRIEVYVSAEPRRRGHHVLPVLAGDRLVTRVDLKTDRATRRRLVKGVRGDPDAPKDAGEALRAELELMAGWMESRHTASG